MEGPSQTASSSRVLCCTVCARRECGDCGASLEDEGASPHTCSADDLETSKAICSTTRKCPCCSTPIERASGCSQMFCTVCKVSFDWRTGGIVRRNIHNPHFFEWRREHTCAEDRLTHPIFTIHPVSGPSPLSDKALVRKVFIVFSSVVSIGAMLDAPGGGRWFPPRRANNSDLRKKLLKNAMSMEAFTRNIERRSIANCRKTEFRALLGTARTVCLDYLAHIQDVITEHENDARKNATHENDEAVCETIRGVMQRIDAYRVIANKSLSDVGDMYGVDSPCLDDAWRIEVQKKKKSIVKPVDSPFDIASSVVPPTIGAKRKLVAVDA